MDWTYAAIMLAAVATGWALFRRQPRPPELLPWHTAAIALGAFCGGMIGAKLPFVLADWQGFLSGKAWLSDGKTILAGLVGGYFGAEATEWALGIRTEVVRRLRRAAGRGDRHRPAGLLPCRLLPRHAHLAALGRRFRRRRGPPPHATLRVGLPPLGGHRALATSAAGDVSRAAHPPLPGGLFCLSLRHGIHPSRADDLAGTDRLSTGGAGADAVFRAVVLSRLSAAVAAALGDCPASGSDAKRRPENGTVPLDGMPATRATGC